MDQDPVRAALLGAATGMRAASPLAAVAITRAGASDTTRTRLIAGAVAEAVADKLPFAPSRAAPPGLAARLFVAGWGGNVLGGRDGAIAGVAASAGATAAFRGLRHLATERAGLSNVTAGILEDVLCLAVVAAAVRP